MKTSQQLNNYYRYIRFIIALVKWICHGLKRRSPWQVKIIYKDICGICPHFDTTTCKLCGCNISADYVLLNKLVWYTEKCPDNPPRWG